MILLLCFFWYWTEVSHARYLKMSKSCLLCPPTLRKEEEAIFEDLIGSLRSLSPSVPESAADSKRRPYNGCHHLRNYHNVITATALENPLMVSRKTRVESRFSLNDYWARCRLFFWTISCPVSLMPNHHFTSQFFHRLWDSYWKIETAFDFKRNLVEDLKSCI